MIIQKFLNNIVRFRRVIMQIDSMSRVGLEIRLEGARSWESLFDRCRNGG